MAEGKEVEPTRVHHLGQRPLRPGVGDERLHVGVTLPECPGRAKRPDFEGKEADDVVTVLDHTDPCSAIMLAHRERKLRGEEWVVQSQPDLELAPQPDLSRSQFRWAADRRLHCPSSPPLFASCAKRPRDRNTKAVVPSVLGRKLPSPSRHPRQSPFATSLIATSRRLARRPEFVVGQAA